jgi:hypothetical protein
MGTDNNARGNFMAPDVARTHGIGRTQFGTYLPPSAKIAAYVRSGGVQDGDDLYIRENLVTTLNAGLARARSGLGDYVVVFPDHAENVASADQMSNLVAGTKIIGLGSGMLRPTLTWTTATSTFLLDVANVALDNFVLKLATSDNAGVTVAAPITVSAAGCSISNCHVRCGDDADDIVTIGITTTAAADDFSITNCQFYGATAAECTTVIRLVGADRFYMANCDVQAATSSTTVGVLQMLTTASTQVLIENCSFTNNKASSVHAATGMAAATGVVRNCQFGILDNATLPGFETEGSLQFYNCFTANLAGEAGAAKTPVST